MPKTKKNIEVVTAANKEVLERLSVCLASLEDSKAVIACSKDWLAVNIENLDDDFYTRLLELSTSTLILDSTTRGTAASVFHGSIEHDNVLLLLRGYATVYPAPRWPYSVECRDQFAHFPKPTSAQKQQFRTMETAARNQIIAAMGGPAEAMKAILNAKPLTAEDQKSANVSTFKNLH